MKDLSIQHCLNVCTLPYSSKQHRQVVASDEQLCFTRTSITRLEQAIGSYIPSWYNYKQSEFTAVLYNNYTFQISPV